MAADLAAALAAIHDAGLAHAAVTAETVLVTAGQPAARLADLGTVRLLRPSGIDADELASSAYAAPELSHTRRRVAATDVYALGIVLYEMLTGRLPYEGGSPAEVLRRHAEEEPVWPLDLPSGLRYVLGRALQPDPADRPWASAIAADLNELRKQLSETPRPARLRTVDPRAQRLIAPDDDLDGGPSPAPPRPSAAAHRPRQRVRHRPAPRRTAAPAVPAGVLHRRTRHRPTAATPPGPTACARSPAAGVPTHAEPAHAPPAARAATARHAAATGGRGASVGGHAAAGGGTGGRAHQPAAARWPAVSRTPAAVR